MIHKHEYTCTCIYCIRYCPTQVYHRYVLGLYRIFEARMNCDRGTGHCLVVTDHGRWSLRAFPTSFSRAVRLRPQWEYGRAQQILDGSRTKFSMIHLTIWIYLTLWITYCHISPQLLAFLKGQEVDDLMLRFWPGVHRCTMVNCWYLRIFAASICR